VYSKKEKRKKKKPALVEVCGLVLRISFSRTT
jgi:hypothetical protein